MLTQVLPKARLMLLLVCGHLTAGCSGLMPQLLIEDSEIAREGSRMATLDTCVARGLASAGIVADYREVQARLLSVSAHNRELFEQRYVASRVELANRPEKAVTKLCRRVDSELPVATKAMQSKYAQVSGLRAPDIVGLTEPASAYQPKGFATAGQRAVARH